jgi:SAM-dependent methyltransferase
MHPVNKVLSLIGLRLSRTSGNLNVPEDFKDQYNRQLNELMVNNRGFQVFQQFINEMGNHPRSHIDSECEFAAKNIAARNPTTILDIGSHRHFIVGLLASYKVMTVDIRKREAFSDNEVVLTSDAKRLDIRSESFDVVVSLCALEHFGLGRYGDEFDIDADKKAFNEMIRVLKPGGMLVFTTTITRAAPSIVFNAHRIYDYEMIKALCHGLELREENFFSYEMGKFCSLDQVSNLPKVWDVYCGCWIKAKSLFN